MAAPAGASGYYRVSEIASGGMGRVDLVVRREGRFARAYAMKRLHGAYQEDAGIRGSFLDEARIAGLVRDIHVVSVLDCGTDADGAWLVMDLVEGLSLSEVMGSLAGSGSRLPVPLAIEIARQAALGLSAAHQLTGSGGRRLGVIHRDVSPQNILLGFDGVVRVTDFGVARAVDNSVHTRAGVLKGKLGYMAPEQLRLLHLDQRTDLYALGVVLWEMLAGRRLRRGEPEAIVDQALHGELPDVEEHCPDLPPALVELLFELLAVDASMRPPDALTVSKRLAEIARELIDDDDTDLATWLLERFPREREEQRVRLGRALEQGSEHLGIDPHRADPVHEDPTVMLGEHAAPPPAPGRRFWPIATALVVLLLCAGAALALLTTRDDPEAPTPRPAEPVSSAREVRATPEPPPLEPIVEEAEEPPPATTKRPRRRSRVQKAPAEPEMHSGSAIPSWDWD